MKKLLLLGCLVFTTEFLFAQFSVDITPDKDNSIYSNNGNSCGVGMLYSGQTCQANFRRAFIHFDIAGSVPAGSTITSVSLDLNNNLNGSATSTDNFDLHPVLADWGEGTSFGTGQGGVAVAPDATWIDRILGTPWTTPGGDFSGAVATTAVGQTFGIYSWSSAGMAINVQTWLDVPAANFGWVLIGNESGSAFCTARRWGSKDAGVSPVLHVNYSCATLPTASCQTNPTIYLDAAGLASFTQANIDNGSTGNCGGPLTGFSFNPSGANCGDAGSTIPVTMTVSDGSNVNSCISNVTIMDTLPPVMSCIGTGAFMLDGTGNLTLTTGDIDAGTTDNCGIASLSLSQTAFTCANLGTNIVTLYATDVNGNIDSCSASIDITDVGGLDIIVDNVVDLLCFGDANGSIDVSITGGTAPYSYDWDNDGTGDFDDTQDLTNLTAGTYILNVNDNGGCTAQEIVVVSEPGEILPTFIITLPTCEGDTDGEIDMSNSGGTAPFLIDWDNDGTGDNDDTEDLTSLDDGSYTVVITDVNGCTGSAIAVVPDGIPVDITVTVTGDILTSNEIPGTFQWLDCPALTVIAGATDSSYTATANGDYAVIVTNNNGCIDTSACATVSEVGFNGTSNDVSIYPNPTAGLLNVELSGFENGVIKIVAMNGKDVLRKSVSNAIEVLDLTELENGVYFLSIQSSSNTVIKRIILQK